MDSNNKREVIRLTATCNNCTKAGLAGLNNYSHWAAGTPHKRLNSTLRVARLLYLLNTRL